MIYLVRHGQTEFNRDGRVQGRVDSPLTGLGLAQATAAGDCLAGLARADAGEWLIETSPLGRARATADIIARRMGLADCRVEPRLIEVSYGALEGLTGPQTEARWPGLAGAGPLFGRAPDGETLEALVARVASWLGEIDPADARRRVVVTHAGVARVLRGLWLGLGEAGMRRLDKPQDVIFRLRRGGEERLECPPLPSPSPTS
jgi:probable phosphoglycerate mutase